MHLVAMCNGKTWRLNKYVAKVAQYYWKYIMPAIAAASDKLTVSAVRLAGQSQYQP